MVARERRATKRGRLGGAAWQGMAESFVALVVALVAGSLVLVATGHDPFTAYRLLVQRTVLRPAGPQEIAVRATPLLIAGLAVVIATRTGLWNIGIDGQVLIGAMAAAVSASWFVDAPRVVLWLAAVVAGLAGGGVWALLPAILRARFGVNEIVTTIMFNYVAMSLTAWLVKGPIRDRSLVSPQTKRVPLDMRLPHIGDTRIHVGAVVALLLAVLLAWAARSTVVGFESRVTGANPRAARHGLIPVRRYLALALIASGALAGLAGANDILSTKGTFQADWNPQYGLAAFALVFLARQNVLALIPAAALFGLLSYGSDVMPRAAGIDPSFFGVIEGSLLIALGVGAWLRRGRPRRAQPRPVPVP